MKEIEGGVIAAKGFRAAGVKADLRNKGKKDMALVFSDAPAVCAGVFTTNVVKAAPVKRDLAIIKAKNKIQAVVLNSGIANACTGKEGELSNQTMAEAMAEALRINHSSVLTASTGVIGMQLPIEKVKNGCRMLSKSLDWTIEAGSDAARAIMTTDTYDKQCAVELQIGGKTVCIGGMSKGSGMIHPDMATMLCVITTDAAISHVLLDRALRADVKNSFHMISVDRDTSTNDSYILMANGIAGNPEITEEGEDYKAFCEALSYVSVTLAKKMAADGEGASKLFEMQVVRAATKEQAVVISRSVISSNLVKTAVFGNDANWGRILCAMGYAGAEFDPDIVDLYISSSAGELKIVENGSATCYSEEEATEILSQKTVVAIADLKLGRENATAWGCDLTYDYVKINGDYRS